MRRRGQYSPQRLVSRVPRVGPNSLLLWHTRGAWGTVQYWPNLETREHPLAQWLLRTAAGPSRLSAPHRILKWRKAFLRSLLGWGGEGRIFPDYLYAVPVMFLQTCSSHERMQTSTVQGSSWSYHQQPGQ